MPRYIDADALKAKYEQMLPEIGDGYHKETLQDCLFELEYAPTIYPDEVRGRGFNKRAEYPSLFTCSVCDFDCNDTYYCSTHNFKYCPNCGAKMEVSEDA